MTAGTIIWPYLSRQDIPHHYKASAYWQIVSALPYLTFAEIKELLSSAPLRAQLDLWGKWLGVKQSDLELYNRAEMSRLIKNMPAPVAQLIAKHYNQQHGRMG